MKLSKKGVLIIAVIIIASSLLSTALAAPKGGPFQDIWDAIFGVQQDVTDLQAQIDDLQANIPVGLPKPDYDSGWITGYPFGEESHELTLTHNLGTRDLFVYIYFKMDDPTIPSPDFTQTHDIRSSDVYWWAYDYNQIVIYFTHGDYVWQQIRVLIWAIPD